MHYRKISVEILEGFWSLLYPHLCSVCGQTGLRRTEKICLSCHYKLPKTQDFKEKENDFTRRFWGRIPLISGAAFYHFVKGGLTQQLLHQLKYNGQKELGTYVGHLLGSVLKESKYFQGIDFIIPVPLHPKKQYIRGYNQSAFFAKGLAEELCIPIGKNILVRIQHANSQTHKSKLERFESMSAAFRLNKPKKIEHKHLLLVDDVLTTGATLEACAVSLLKVPGTRLSMATIARANL